jgi:hypothetical protein
MNTLKKALYVGFGVTFIILGLGATCIFILVNDVGLSSKIMGIVGGLATVVFGWWLLRRGSNSVWDALGWLFAHIIP